LLLERIIEIATDKHDCVLDPFCGSGTTLIAAHILGRDYIGIDVSEEAVKLSKARLLEPTKTESYLLKVGEEGFLEKPESERRILKAIDAIPVERNSGLDGFLKFHVNGRPISVRIQKNGEDIETAKQKLITASASKNCGLMILIRTQDIENGTLFGGSWDNESLLVIVRVQDIANIL
jgi:site-specific DNA-methyltransferase (adenine-specific)